MFYLHSPVSYDKTAGKYPLRTSLQPLVFALLLWFVVKIMVNPCVSSLPNVCIDTEMQDTPGLYQPVTILRVTCRAYQEAHLQRVVALTLL